MDLNHWLEKIRDHGIFVSTDEEQSKVFCALFELSACRGDSVERCGRTVGVSSGEILGLPEGNYIDEVRIFKRTHQWLMTNYPEMNWGAGSFDKISYHGTFEEITEKVIAYFTKGVINFDGWLVPVYQSPSWSEELISSTIRGAKLISVENAPKGIDYMSLENVDDKRLLFLRRDGREALLLTNTE